MAGPGPGLLDWQLDPCQLDLRIRPTGLHALRDQAAAHFHAQPNLKTRLVKHLQALDKFTLGGFPGGARALLPGVLPGMLAMTLTCLTGTVPFLASYITLHYFLPLALILKASQRLEATLGHVGAFLVAGATSFLYCMLYSLWQHRRCNLSPSLIACINRGAEQFGVQISEKLALGVVILAFAAVILVPVKTPWDHPWDRLPGLGPVATADPVDDPGDASKANPVATADPVDDPGDGLHRGLLLLTYALDGEGILVAGYLFARYVLPIGILLKGCLMAKKAAGLTTKGTLLAAGAATFAYLQLANRLLPCTGSMYTHMWIFLNAWRRLYVKVPWLVPWSVRCWVWRAEDGLGMWARLSLQACAALLLAAAAVCVFRKQSNPDAVGVFRKLSVSNPDAEEVKERDWQKGHPPMPDTPFAKLARTEPIPDGWRLATVEDMQNCGQLLVDGELHPIGAAQMKAGYVDKTSVCGIYEKRPADRGVSGLVSRVLGGDMGAARAVYNPEFEGVPFVPLGNRFAKLPNDVNPPKGWRLATKKDLTYHWQLYATSLLAPGEIVALADCTAALGTDDDGPDEFLIMTPDDRDQTDQVAVLVRFTWGEHEDLRFKLLYQYVPEAVNPTLKVAATSKSSAKAASRAVTEEQLAAALAQEAAKE
ncbi:hypothetical protein WJX72_004706 [[Myrmecia] bisecta]|uniref:Uncharacterized protein n=1 Tax=[Myrmecia] bisecta TaxID=41462 RepID=A0AAW1PPR3_9CHLO